MLRGRSCSPNQGAGFSCPSHRYSAFGHAHSGGALERVALWGAACHLVPPRWPNQALQRTPLAASEIAPILTRSVCWSTISFYRCGAAKRQSVGPQPLALIAIDADGTIIPGRILRLLNNSSLLCSARLEYRPFELGCFFAC